MEIILKIIQVILALSLLVLVHEFGHYIMARIFGIKVEKFYLFFPPAIFKFKPKKSDTEFGIGCIPLGGFCKIAGMVDESLDTGSMSTPPKPWEFRSRPAWQRLLVMTGGILMNLILAIIIYTGLLAVFGEEYLKTDDAVYGIEPNGLASEMGFRSGDRVIAFDGDPAPENFMDLQPELLRSQIKTVTVVRDGDTLGIGIDPAYFPAMLNTPGMFGLRIPVAVGEIPDTSINAGSELAPGDRLVRAGSTDIRFYPELQKALGRLKGTTAGITVERDGQLMEIPLKVSNDGKMEVLLSGDISDFHLTVKEYSLLTAIPAGTKKTFATVGDYVKELGLIFKPGTEAYKSVGSFITIGSVFPGSWNWQVFWNITALLSVMLAILNLIPIPALDGGHILFTLYEMVTRRKPSVRFLETAQIIGMIFLFGLIILAFGNDIGRLLQ